MSSGARAADLPPASAHSVQGELQPLLRVPADDAIARQAELLARLYRGRVHALRAGAALPKGVAAGDLLISEPVVPAQLRPGDLLAVRTNGDPAPYVTDPVSLRRYARVDDCGDGCRRVVTTTLERAPAEHVKWIAVTGRVVFAMDRRSGELRELRDPDEPRPITLAEAYNAWRPRWTAEAVGTRLEELREPAKQTPRRVYSLDALALDTGR